MAKENKNGGNDRLLWVAGTAAVTAFVVWYVNKELRTREDIQRQKLMMELQAAKGGA